MKKLSLEETAKISSITLTEVFSVVKEMLDNCEIGEGILIDEDIVPLEFQTFSVNLRSKMIPRKISTKRYDNQYLIVILPETVTHPIRSKNPSEQRPLNKTGQKNKKPIKGSETRKVYNTFSYPEMRKSTLPQRRYWKDRLTQKVDALPFGKAIYIPLDEIPYTIAHKNKYIQDILKDFKIVLSQDDYYLRIEKIIY